MKRKDYMEPTIRIVKLQHRTALLQASRQASGKVNATMNGTWEEETIDE